MSNGWTIAYRKPRANRFLRVDLDLSWGEAERLADKVATALPDQQVYYVPNARAEREGYVVDEDRGNILVDSGRRVRVREGGVLPEGIDVDSIRDKPAIEVDSQVIVTMDGRDPFQARVAKIQPDENFGPSYLVMPVGKSPLWVGQRCLQPC